MKRFWPWLMLLIFLGSLYLGNQYLSLQYADFFKLQENQAFLIFILLTIFMMAGLAGFSNSRNILGSWMYRLSGIIIGFMLYLLLVTFLLNLIKIFINLSPGLQGFLGFGITFLIAAGAMIHALNVKIKHVNIPIKGLNTEMKVMHWSDLHLGHYRGRNFLEKLVERTNEADASLLFITGDLFDGKIRITKETLLPLKNLKVPVFFVEGNHDIYSGVKKIKQLLRDLNVFVLENEIHIFNELQIIGLNHMKADDQSVQMHHGQGKNTIRDVLNEMDIAAQSPAILLHHSPDGIQYANLKNIDLYLSGHTHAGQLFPVNFLNDLIFKYNKGLHNYKGTRIFVSQGAGTFGPPMRLGTSSEIAMIALKPAQYE